jgi:hypothetical protein
MGQTPPKYFLPSAPYGASEGANALNPVQPGAVNPQTPLLPPNFQDPGTMTTANAAQMFNPANMGGGPRGGNPFSGMNPFLKGLFLFFLLLFAPSVWATTTVTGTLQNLGTGTVGQGAFVRFWLRGCGGNIPRINGTAVIAPSQGGVYYFDLAANSSGVISGTLYSTRDATGLLAGDIECGGSKTSVWYGMQIFVGGKGGAEVPIHAKNGVALDITGVTPISQTPPIVAPNGDATYARLDGGNTPFTALINFRSGLSLGAASSPTFTKNPSGPYAGSALLNTGLFAQSSIATVGAFDLQNNATGVIFRNGVFNGTLGKSGTVQAGDTSSGTATWNANNVYNLPDLSQGSGIDTSGFLYGASSSILNASVGHCVIGGGTNTTNSAGSLLDSTIGCNTHIVFPVNTRQVQWVNGANTGALTSVAVTGNRTWTLPDVSGTPVMVVYSTASGSTNSSIGATTMATAGSGGNTFRFTFYVDQVAVGIGCSGNTTVVVNATWTDPNAGAPVTGNTSNATIAGNGTAGQPLGTLTVFALPITIRAKASTAVQYSTLLTPDGTCGTKPTYQVYPVLEQLN